MPSHKNRNKEPRSEPRSEPQRGTLDPQLVEYLNEQIQESEQSILNWLEGVLNTRPDAPRVEAPRLHGGPARSQGLPPNAVMIAGAIALVALIGLGWMGFKASRADDRIAMLEKQIVALSQATGVPPPVTTTTNNVDEGVTDLLKTPEALTGAGWPERFQWAIENRQNDIVPLITRIARNAPPDRLSGEKANDIQRIVDILDENQILSSADRRSLRAYLFELIASERHPTGGKKLSIDAAPADVPASAIAKVKEDLQIRTALNDPGGAELQSEVVLRWIAQQR